MKKLFYAIGFVSLFLINNINASSIDYNLEINETMHFYETIVYKIENNDVKNTNEYSFLTSIVKDKIYFNKDSNVFYTKTVTKTNEGYIVTLKHNYSGMFFGNSRIAKECFGDISLTSDTNGLSFESSEPFFCYSRANSITVNITTPLAVITSNSDSVNNNTYTWNNITKDTTFSFSTSAIKVESEPMDDHEESDDDNSQDITNIEENEEKEKNRKATYIIAITVVIGALVLGLLSFIILQKRNKDLNKL